MAASIVPASDEATLNEVSVLPGMLARALLEAHVPRGPFDQMISKHGPELVKELVAVVERRLGELSPPKT